MKSKNYNLSVGKIGNLECDFIARRGIDEYFYIQVSKNIDDENYIKQLRVYYDYVKSISDKKVYLYLYSILDNKVKEIEVKA